MTSNRFKLKTALVTGASGGIGGAIANALAKEGADVHGFSRKEQDTGRLIWHNVDLADEDGLKNATEMLASTFSELDCLVHSAGAFAMGTVSETETDTLDQLLQVNARAPWMITRALLPALEARNGSIVFINSSIWDNARGGIGAYAASKYALKAIADALRDEVNGLGIRVLSVFPGRTASAMQQAMFAVEGRDYSPDQLLQPEDISRFVLESLATAPTAELTDLYIRPGKKP